MSNALLQPPSVELIDSLSKSRAIMIMELCAKLLVNCLKYLPEESRARLSAVCEWLVQKPILGPGLEPKHELHGVADFQND